MFVLRIHTKGTVVLRFLYSMSSKPALGSTHPPIQWVPGALSLGVAAGA
jgi:hypothetical protein